MEEKENEWLPFPKKDILSTAFSYARYTKGMEKITGFGMKNSITLPSLANMYFNNVRDHNDEPIYTYNDEFMRHFVRKNVKGGLCSALNQNFKSSISDKVFNIISQELNVQGNFCEIIDKYIEFTNKHRTIIKDEYDSQFDEYRDINQERKEKYVNDKLSKLLVHEKLQKLYLIDVMTDLDATSL